MPSTTGTDQQNTDIYGTLVKDIVQTFKKVEPVKDQNAAFFVGSTGAGKSTTVAYLIGCDMMVEEDNDIGERRIIANGQGCPKIGHQLAASETVYPEFFKLQDDEGSIFESIKNLLSFQDKNSGFGFIDCPGFKENREGKKLITAIGTQYAIKQVKKVQAVVGVISVNTLTASSNRGESFIDVLHSISSILKDPEKNKASIFFLFTHSTGIKKGQFVKRLENFYKDVQEKIEKEGRSESEDLSILSMMDIILSNPNNIFLVDPTDGGKSKNLIVSALKRATPISIEDIGAAVDSSSRNLINAVMSDVAHDGIKTAEILLKNPKKLTDVKDFLKMKQATYEELLDKIENTKEEFHQSRLLLYERELEELSKEIFQKKEEINNIQEAIEQADRDFIEQHEMYNIAPKIAEMMKSAFKKETQARINEFLGNLEELRRIPKYGANLCYKVEIQTEATESSDASTITTGANRDLLSIDLEKNQVSSASRVTPWLSFSTFNNGLGQVTLVANHTFRYVGSMTARFLGWQPDQSLLAVSGLDTHSYLSLAQTQRANAQEKIETSDTIENSAFYTGNSTFLKPPSVNDYLGVIGPYMAHYVRKYSPITLPWNQLRPLKTSEKIQLNQHQKNLELLAKNFSFQRDNYLAKSWLPKDKIAFVERQLKILNREIIEILKNNQTTNSTYTGISGRVQKVTELSEMLSQHYEAVNDKLANRISSIGEEFTTCVEESGFYNENEEERFCQSMFPAYSLSVVSSYLSVEKESNLLNIERRLQLSKLK